MIRERNMRLHNQKRTQEVQEKNRRTREATSKILKKNSPQQSNSENRYSRLALLNDNGYEQKEATADTWITDNGSPKAKRFMLAGRHLTELHNNNNVKILKRVKTELPKTVISRGPEVAHPKKLKIRFGNPATSSLKQRSMFF